MANIFDQFDNDPPAQTGGNYFDQFDELRPNQQRPNFFDQFDNDPPEQQQPAGVNPYIAQGLSGINEGLANIAGFPVDIANMAYGGAKDLAGYATGQDFGDAPEAPIGGSQFFKDMMGQTNSIAPESNVASEQFTRRVGQEVGAMAVPGLNAVGKARQPIKAATQMLATGVGSGIGAATAQQVAPDSMTAEIVGQMAGGLTPTALASRARNKAAIAKALKAVPTRSGLKKQAKGLYHEADKLGVRANPQQVQGLGNKANRFFDSEGVLIDGQLVEGYPKLSAAKRQIERFKDGGMSVPQMQTVRRTLNKAASSADSTEKRMGIELLRQFDDFTAPLAPPLEEARGLYHRSMKAKELDTLSDLAEADAMRSKSLGYEDTLRNQFGGLEKQIIRGREKRFTPEEFAAIQKVSRGTTGGNIARKIGGFAPNGPVSAISSVGLPGVVGTAAFGPIGGIGAVGATAGLTSLAKHQAGKMTINNARLADILIRNGKPLATKANPSKAQMNLIRAMLLGQAANLAGTK